MRGKQMYLGFLIVTPNIVENVFNDLNTGVATKFYKKFGKIN